MSPVNYFYPVLCMVTAMRILGCKKLNNLVVHTTVLFQNALNSDTEVNREKKSSLNHKIKVTVVFSEKH